MFEERHAFPSSRAVPYPSFVQKSPILHRKHSLEGIVPLESHVPEGRFFVRKKTQHVQLRLSKTNLKMVLTNTKSDQFFNPKSLSASKFQCIISMLLLDLKSCRKENIVSSIVL